MACIINGAIESRHKRGSLRTPFEFYRDASDRGCMSRRMTSGRRLISGAAIGALTLLLSACGGGGGGGDDNTATGLASECFNPVLYAVGTTFRLDYQVTGAGSGSVSRVGAVVRQTSFEGVPDLTEAEIESTSSFTLPGTPTVTEQLLTRNYGRLDGTTLMEHGFVEQNLSDPAVGITRRVYTPPRSDSRASLALGQSLQITTTTTDTVTTAAGVPVSVDSSTQDERITYRGQESITVPAGTFVACKFEYEPEGAGGPVDIEWVQVGKGAQIKYLSGQGTAFEITFELMPTSRLNGVAL